MPLGTLSANDEKYNIDGATKWAEKVDSWTTNLHMAEKKAAKHSG